MIKAVKQTSSLHHENRKLERELAVTCYAGAVSKWCVFDAGLTRSHSCLYLPWVLKRFASGTACFLQILICVLIHLWEAILTAGLLSLIVESLCFRSHSWMSEILTEGTFCGAGVRSFESFCCGLKWSWWNGWWFSSISQQRYPEKRSKESTGFRGEVVIQYQSVSSSRLRSNDSSRFVWCQSPERFCMVVRFWRNSSQSGISGISMSITLMCG